MFAAEHPLSASERDLMTEFVYHRQEADRAKERLWSLYERSEGSDGAAR